MKILREEFVKELGKNPLADILSEGREQCNRIIRSAWLNYARADNDKAKNFYLNTILQAEKEKAELYKKVGLLKAEVQQVEDVAARIIKAVVEAEKD
jgi:adenine-specific DNA methylase